MRTDDFDYYLPEEFIAQTPLEKRDESRLMILDKNTGEIIEIMESTSDTNNFLDKMIKHIESLMSAENKIIEEAEKIIAVAHTRWLSENHLPGLYRHERKNSPYTEYSI